LTQRPALALCERDDDLIGPLGLLVLTPPLPLRLFTLKLPCRLTAVADALLGMENIQMLLLLLLLLWWRNVGLPLYSCIDVSSFLHAITCSFLLHIVLFDVNIVLKTMLNALTWLWTLTMDDTSQS
jgi:hypothetical protein